MMDLRQTKDVLSYLTEMDRLNAYVKLSDSQMIDFISYGIKESLQEDMKHYKILKTKPDEWRYKLIEMDTSSKTSKSTLNSAYAVSSSSTAPKKQQRKGKIISKEQMTKRKQEKRCLKCSRSNHMIKDCRNRQYRDTPEPYDKRTQDKNPEEPPTKKPRTNQSGQIQLISAEERLVEI